MVRSRFRTHRLIVVSFLVSGTAAAQGPGTRIEPAPTPAGALAPGTSVVPPPVAPGADPQAPPPGVLSAPSATSNGVAPGMKGTVGFGVGVLPNVELLGTSGAVALKAWLNDTLAIAPLFSFAYTAPKGTDASWHLRPELIVLFAPFRNASTRFEFGGGLGFALNKAPPAVMDPSVPTESTNTTFELTLPIQAGVEHFFTRWLSVGIAARTDLVAYTEDGDFHQIAFSIDSTSLLGQLFFYTD